MQLQTADAVWSRIETLAREEPGGVLATDGDGTLWRGDVGEDLFHAFLDSGRWEPPGLDAVRRSALSHGLSDAGTGSEVARRILEAYGEGQYPEEPLCELMTWCFAGWKRQDVQRFARGVVDDADLGERLNAEVVELVTRARAIGVEVVLVSASPLCVVLEAGARVGFDAARVVAARPLYDEDVMVAAVERPIPYAAGKVTRLRENLGADRVLYAAFGDNVFDLAMLASARVPVAVRPKPRLRAQAATLPGLVELAHAASPSRATAR